MSNIFRFSHLLFRKAKEAEVKFQNQLNLYPFEMQQWVRGCKSWQSKICKGNSSKGKMDPRVCWLFNTVWKLSLSSSTSWSLMVWNIPWEYQNMGHKSFCYDWDKIASIIHDLNKKRWVVNQGGWISNKGNLYFEEIHIRHWLCCAACWW